MTTTRRLAAIMAADVAGFSAAMERDEEGTFALVQELRRKIIEPKIAEHQGRLIKTTGDGFLAEFASPIAAMRAALAIQAATANTALQLRIGINLGDVIVEESGDVYGEGVNVAARLEALADVGGILISGKVHSEIEGKVEAAFEDRGEQQVKNIARPVRIHAALVAGAKPSPSVARLTLLDADKPLPLPDKPSIAVLPFQNMSGDPEQEYFADGMVEDIITALSRFKSLFVIARNSSFSYKGKSPDIRQVGRDLGVRYVLEGSVRKAGSRVRITGQLVEAANGAHLWADKFDGALEDVFDLQDQVTERVITAIAPTIQEAEIKRARSNRDVNLSAHDCYWRAVSAFNRSPSTDPYEAIRLCRRAIELSPAFAAAHALAAASIAWLSYQGGFSDFASQSSEALVHAKTALELDPSDPDVMARAGMALGNFGDKALSRYWGDRAVSENPNLAYAWRIGGMDRVANGPAHEAPERFQRSLRLDPSDPRIWIAYSGLSLAQSLLFQYEDAFRSAERAVTLTPNNVSALSALVISAALKGDLDSARRGVATVVRNDPSASISKIIDPLRRVHWKDDHLDRFAEGWRLAGLPE